MRKYFEKVRPAWTSPSDQLFNHAWVLGGTGSISWDLQLEIDSLLEPR